MRPSPSLIKMPSLCFNPRTRKGCDDLCQKLNIYLYSFNPRTRKGCDFGIEADQQVIQGFNPRTRKGCDIAIRSCPI